jgi:hypothetical protein
MHTTVERKAEPSKALRFSFANGQKVTAKPVSTRHSGSGWMPLRWEAMGTPTETKPDHLSTDSRSPGDK